MDSRFEIGERSRNGFMRYHVVENTFKSMYLTAMESYLLWLAVDGAPVFCRTDRQQPSGVVVLLLFATTVIIIPTLLSPAACSVVYPTCFRRHSKNRSRNVTSRNRRRLSLHQQQQQPRWRNERGRGSSKFRPPTASPRYKERWKKLAVVV